MILLKALCLKVMVLHTSSIGVATYDVRVLPISYLYPCNDTAMMTFILMPMLTTVVSVMSERSN